MHKVSHTQVDIRKKEIAIAIYCSFYSSLSSNACPQPELFAGRTTFWSLYKFVLILLDFINTLTMYLINGG